MRAEHASGIARACAAAKPEHVHRRAEIVDFETGALAHRRMAAVAADDEIGADLERARPACRRARRRRGRRPRSDRSPRRCISRWKLGIALALLAPGNRENPIAASSAMKLHARRQPAEVGDADRSCRRTGVERSATCWCGSLRNSSSRPSSCITCSVEGCTVSPRKSRRKSACFSSTSVSMPARASR